MTHGDEGGKRAEGRQGTQAGLLTLDTSWHRGKAWSDDTSQLGPDKHTRDVPSLDKYAEERWEVRTWDCVYLCLCSCFLWAPEASLSLRSSGGAALHGGLPRCSCQPGLGSAPHPGWAHEEVRKPGLQQRPGSMYPWVPARLSVRVGQEWRGLTEKGDSSGVLPEVNQKTREGQW